MSASVQLLFAAGLFLLALRLSAFFSGSETGFYRLSSLRISLDARAGDAAAQRLARFVRNPSRFVATTLVVYSLFEVAQYGMLLQRRAVRFFIMGRQKI